MKGVGQALAVLAPLAWAEGSGLPRRLWPPLASALAPGYVITDQSIDYVHQIAGEYITRLLFPIFFALARDASASLMSSSAFRTSSLSIPRSSRRPTMSSMPGASPP